MDQNSVEYKERRDSFLNGQERLFDLVNDTQGGVLKKSLGDEIYKLYTTEGLTTAQVAERVDCWVEEGRPVIVRTPEEKVEEALNRAFSLSGFDGSWHKEYAIDQMVRALTGPKYREWVAKFEDGEDGPETYNWETGTPP